MTAEIVYQEYFTIRHALTRGIEKKQLKVTSDDYLTEPDNPWSPSYYLGENAFKTLPEAIEKAELMRTRKLVSLRRQVKKIEAMDFSVLETK